MFEFTDSGLILADVYVNGTKTFTSANIKNGTFSVNRYSSSAVAPEFGNVTAGELIFSIDTTTVTPNISKGDVITATLYLSDDPTVTKEVGDFIITNLTKGVDSLDVTCLDRMIELDGVADLTGVTYPITATNFINQVFGTGLGFTVNIDSGVYGAVSLHQPYFEEKTTYRQVLSKVCECMGANAWYTDRLNIGWYKDTEEEIDETTYIDCDLAETGYPISVEVTPDISALPVEITDTGIVLRVVNNPFMVAASIQEWEANAQAIMQNIGNVTFYGASFTVLPMPELKPMDIVTIDNKLVPITSVTYGINENTKVESRVDEGDNLYNYDFSRQIEIAKETAKEAEEKVDDLNAYFWHDNLGAHVSDTPASTAGKNVLVDSDSFDIRDGTNTLATVTAVIQDGNVNGYFAVNDDEGEPLFAVGGGTRSSGTVTEYQSFMQNKDESVYTTYYRMDVPAANAKDVTLKERIGLIKDGSSYTNGTASRKQIELYNGSTIRQLGIDSSGGVALIGTGTSGAVIRANWEGSIACIGQDIPANSNLNNYLTPGEYVCRTTTIAGTLTNSPTTLAFRMTVTSITNRLQDVNHIVQTVTDYKCNEALRYAEKSSSGTWSYSQWYTKANLYRSSPTITRNTSYVTSDWGSASYIQSNILYLNVWFKFNGSIPYDTTLFTLPNNTTRGYFPLHTATGVAGQVKTDSGTKTIKVNGAISASSAYHYINAVIPLL